MRTKIFKILFWLLLWFVTAAVVVGAIIRSESFQHWVTQKAAQYLSKELQTQVSIGGFDVNNLTHLSIDSVFIGDRHNDTAFYLNKVTVDLDRLTWDFEGKEQRLNMKYAKIDGALVNFKKYNDTGKWNYEFVIDYFDPPRDSADTTPSRPFILKVDKVRLNNSVFSFTNSKVAEVGNGKFNPDDFRFKNISATLDKFTLFDDSLSFGTENLTAFEKNGFLVKQIKADVHIHPNGLEFLKMSLETEKSLLKDELRMLYSGWNELGDFIEKVDFDARLNESNVSMEDIAFWGPGMENLKQTFVVSGLVRGTIDNLKAKEININAGEESYLTGDFSIKGLPEFEASFIDARLEKSHTNTGDIKRITGITDLPDGIIKLGDIDFTGSFTGFPSSFVAYGDFKTSLGELTSDIKLDFTQGNDNATYSGYLKTNSFKLGKFVEQESLLGNIALDAKVEGVGLTWETIDVEIDGDINTITFNDYQYKNVVIDGHYASKQFDGFAKIRDENLDLDFDGGIDFTDSLPTMNFVSTIRKANLNKIKLDTVSSSLTAKLYINFTGNTLDNLDGIFSVSDVEYRRETKLLQLDSMWLQANYSSTVRSLHFTSSILDCDISGRYNFSQIDDALYNYASHLLPKIIEKDTGELVDENFNFKIKVKRPYLLANFLWDEVSIDPFEATGSINTAKNDIQLNITTEQLLYKQMTFRQIAVKTIPVAGNAQKLQLKCGKFFQGDSLYLENASVALTFDSSNVLFDIIAPKTIARLNAHLKGSLLLSDSLYRLVFENSTITSKKRVWDISNNSYLSYAPETKRYLVQNFQISSSGESMELNGAVSSDINDTLRVDFDNFDIADVNYFTRPPKEQELGGILNGKIVVFNLLDVPLFTSDLYADSLSFGSDTLGNLVLEAHNDNAKKISVDGKFSNGRLEGSQLGGWVTFDKESTQNINLNFNLNNATTRFFEPFLTGVVSNLKGSFTTKINIRGTFADPQITGGANFSKPSFKIDYLQTTYSADTIVVSLTNSRIKVESFVLKDEQGTMANAFGYISHDAFSDFRVNFKIQEMNRFLALNTTANDNDLYFGTAYMTGSFSISGPFDDLYMEVKARTERGTNFNLMFADEGGVNQYDFITFVNYGEEPSEKAEVDLSGIRLSLDLEVTPDADIKIIFDSQLGDIIQGAGYADLRMEINTLGDFKMFGTFEIERGKYLFTALDVINRNFSVRKGGTIVWTGDPLEARIDITAVYATRTSTQPLVMGVVAESELVNYSTPIPVEAVMKLRGQLLKPDIKFGIDVPDLTLLRGSDANTSVLINAIRRVERDPEEVSRQVFSLISLGTFATPIDNGYAGSGAESPYNSNPGYDAATTTVGNFLSTRLTNWLSKYDPKWNIGVQVGQGGATARTEVMLTASRQWLNDRLQLDVAADNTSQGNINVNYKITPNGDNQVRIFGRNTNNPIYNQNILSFGGGFYFRKEFEDFDELRRKLFGKKLEQTQPQIQPLDSIPQTSPADTIPPSINK